MTTLNDSSSTQAKNINDIRNHNSATENVSPPKSAYQSRPQPKFKASEWETTISPLNKLRIVWNSFDNHRMQVKKLRKEQNKKPRVRFAKWLVPGTLVVVIPILALNYASFASNQRKGSSNVEADKVLSSIYALRDRIAAESSLQGVRPSDSKSDETNLNKASNLSRFFSSTVSNIKEKLTNIKGKSKSDTNSSEHQSTK